MWKINFCKDDELPQKESISMAKFGFRSANSSYKAI